MTHLENLAEEYAKTKAPTQSCEHETLLAVEGYLAGAKAALEMAANIAEDCGRSNVENPAIDAFERMRRIGIRWCGEWTAKRIRAIADRSGE